MQRAYGLEIPQTLEEVCDPRRMALVVYDMQVGILRQLEDGEAILQRVGQLLEAARAGGFRVIFLRHLSLPKELMGVFQFRMAMAWQRVDTVEQVSPWFLRDSPGFQLVPELAPRPSEAILDKITMSAFEGTPLDIALRDCGLVAFAIVGVATEIGIAPTVRHGADLGYIPVVVTDACGAGHDEAADHAIADLEHAGDALMTDVATITALLRGQRSG
jgi:nicotinamidase-related amidase